MTRPSKTPDALIRGGPQGDQCLLNPRERREIMEFEHKNVAAKKMISTADGSRNRLLHLMQTKDPHGVIGVDSVANEGSRVYGETARLTRERINRKNKHAGLRRERFEQLGTSAKKLGYNVFQHNEGEWVGGERVGG